MRGEQTLHQTRSRPRGENSCVSGGCGLRPGIETESSPWVCQANPASWARAVAAFRYETPLGGDRGRGALVILVQSGAQWPRDAGTPKGCVWGLQSYVLRYDRKGYYWAPGTLAGARRGMKIGRATPFARRPNPDWRCLAYAEGVLHDRIRLRRVANGHRPPQNARPTDGRFLTYNMWQVHWADPTSQKGGRRGSSPV